MAILKKHSVAALGLLLSAASSSVSSVGAAKNDRRFRQPRPSVTVMSRNLYVGFNFNLLFAADGGSNAILEQFQSTRFDLRAQALALEICENQPDMIGLQEVATITVSGMDLGSGEGAPLSFLDVLMPTIVGICGMAYSPAIVSRNTVFGPIDTEFGEATSIDEDVILVNNGEPDLIITGSETGTFSDILMIPLPAEFGGITAPFPRSWQYIDATVGVDALPVRFANTHLETSAPFSPGNEPLNIAQAEEFIEAVVETLPDDHALIAVGDFNCVPTSDTYHILTDDLEDAWVDVNDDDEGFTCCEDAALDNTVTSASARIDYVFFRDSADFCRLDSKKADLTGSEPFQAVAPHWPSDHAGIVSTFKFDNRHTSDSSDFAMVA